MTSGLELTENHSESGQRGGRRTRHCMLSRLQVAVFVTVAILLMAVVGILMAMFGPGSKNLKYRDDEDCKGRTDVYVQRYGIGSSKNTGLGKFWLEREISEAYLTGPGPGGVYLRNFWVGMCCLVTGTLNLYQS